LFRACSALVGLQVSTGSAEAGAVSVIIPWSEADWDFVQNMYPMLRPAKKEMNGTPVGDKFLTATALILQGTSSPFIPADVCSFK
jgi:hypothetical protein